VKPALSIRADSPGLALAFSCLGHTLMHLFAALYFVVVLALETAWGRPYHELVELWTLGALLVGLGALPAGWLADRWSAPGMLAVMFLGLGGAALACSRADSPASLRAALAALGLFAAIYHPVGIPWVVRAARSSGRALGVNGVFGSLGVASAAVVAGWLIDRHGWPAAFAVPGLVSLAAGVSLAVCIRLGWVADLRAAPARHDEPAHGGRRLSFALLLSSMACVGVIFQATQAALPKHFERNVGALLGSGASGVGVAVGAVYLGAGLVQIVGGQLADRVSLKRLYVTGLLLQVPLLALVARVGGWALLVAAALAALLNATVLPAENLLLAGVAPDRHQSLAFGAKFVVSFGTAPLAVQLVSWVDAGTSGLESLFLILAGVAACAAAAAVALPARRGRPRPRPPGLLARGATGP
jgi:MFS family permease